MTAVITAFHVIVCFALILIVLLQTGKGSDMGAAFGGSSQTLFGSSGPATFLNKITTIAAVVFMITSLTLAYFSVDVGSSSIMKDEEAKPGVEKELPKGPDIEDLGGDAE
ncbi:MAG: preprotein translocase subunit SecG [Deltaproteobacteria bacterium]|uniref:Protein-export membrane protein SecG n=1 Tax=Candidatus Zymogenus saltonus TaxID=2844893 RepID=A0A9D8PQ56_9DELT|nr:preprotein translocase subunit SecG [Candidatus Zymogenus saltonus]